jgi:hypothetical protein
MRPTGIKAHGNANPGTIKCAHINRTPTGFIWTPTETLYAHREHSEFKTQNAEQAHQ